MLLSVCVGVYICFVLVCVCVCVCVCGCVQYTIDLGVNGVRVPLLCHNYLLYGTACRLPEKNSRLLSFFSNVLLAIRTIVGRLFVHTLETAAIEWLFRCFSLVLNQAKLDNLKLDNL